jgi:hypothetical protein
MRVVDDMAGQRGKRLGGPGGAEPEQREKRNEQPAQNFTFGAASASGVAVNSASGLFLE